jgi:hypothetical protein
MHGKCGRALEGANSNGKRNKGGFGSSSFHSNDDVETTTFYYHHFGENE